MKGKGKQFEEVVSDSFELISNVAVTRLKDDTFKYKGARNPCDFLVYHKPYLYAIECKSVFHNNTLSIYSTNSEKCYGAITNGQWDGLLKMSRVNGVIAGIMCWWVDKDTTRFIPIQMLEAYRANGHKSIRYDVDSFNEYLTIELMGQKKRVYYEYDMQAFFDETESLYGL